MFDYEMKKPHCVRTAGVCKTDPELDSVVSRRIILLRFGALAQLVEQQTLNLRVVGSSPTRLTILFRNQERQLRKLPLFISPALEIFPQFVRRLCRPNSLDAIASRAGAQLPP